MRFSIIPQLLLALVLSAASASAVPTLGRRWAHAIKPKVFIISMFAPEASVWYGIKDFDVLAQNITIPGLSPLFPDAHCTKNGDICQITTGESEINAATTISSLVASDAFDLTTTYFLIAGIAGVNPKYATLGGVSFARYAVQVALQYEIDAREIPSNWTTGYFAQGAYNPGEYPKSIYGTEVFEVSTALRAKAVAFARKAKLVDSTAAIAYRAHYGLNSSLYAAATLPPSVVECDVATSDVYYSGTLLGEAFENVTTLLTNGTGVYCATAQEDNATLEVLTRAARFKKVDFARIIVMRTFSDFDRPYAGEAATTNLLYSAQGGFPPAIANIYLAGIEVVSGLLAGWNAEFATGVPPTNYIGDIFGSLGGTPDFGPGGPSIAGFFKKRAAASPRARLAERAMDMDMDVDAVL